MLEKDIITAMKNKDPRQTNSLRYIKSLLLENKKSAKPREELEVLLSYKKTLEKSLEIYVAIPEELAKINYDLALLSKYLPKPLAEEEVKEIITQIKKDKNIAEFSILMKESISALKGKVDGKIVSALVKIVLSEEKI